MVEIELATVTIGSLNSQDLISFMIATESLSSQDMIHQVNVYVMEIVWILCDVYVWWSKFQQRVIWFCKASLKICYVILFLNVKVLEC